MSYTISRDEMIFYLGKSVPFRISIQDEKKYFSDLREERMRRNDDWKNVVKAYRKSKSYSCYYLSDLLSERWNITKDGASSWLTPFEDGAFMTRKRTPRDLQGRTLDYFEITELRKDEEDKLLRHINRLSPRFSMDTLIR